MAKKIKKKVIKKKVKKKVAKKTYKPKPEFVVGVSYSEGLDWEYPFNSFPDDDEDECPRCGSRLWQ
jgi:hypothetical protein